MEMHEFSAQAILVKGIHPFINVDSYALLPHLGLAGTGQISGS